MSTRPPLGIDDYPLAERRPERVAGRRGKGLGSITLEAVVEGAVTPDDLAITRDALMMQAEIARAAGRATLAMNFERAAELTGVPDAVVMRVYEMLRPGRAGSAAALRDMAHMLRAEHGAEKMAAFVEEAADIYDSRGLFTSRF